MQTGRYDQIENLNGALIQHGPYNCRIYLMDIGKADPETLVPELITLARKNGYSKIFAKVPSSKSIPFTVRGFQQEAGIPLFYRGTEDVSFLGYYLNNSRRDEPYSREFDSILKLSASKQKNSKIKPLSNDCRIRKCTFKDVEAMAEIYRAVFPTYPFPIHDPRYIHHTMETHIEYFGIEYSGQLIALSSAETDRKSKNAEMTDFATLPEWRGHSFAHHLLKKMETAIKTEGFQLAYTIARAASPGMNITFARLGYTFNGRLINNTNISGRIESMNVWHKRL